MKKYKLNDLIEQCDVNAPFADDSSSQTGGATKGKDTTRTKRSTALLARLSASGGKPVRVDTNGDDLKLLDALVQGGYEANRAAAYRKAIREAHAKWAKKLKILDAV